MTGGLSRRQLLQLGALAPAAIALSGVQIPAAAAATADAVPSVARSGKKGVGVARLAAQGAYRVQTMNPAWYYTWAPTGITGVNGVEFVPMVWGATDDYDVDSGSTEPATEPSDAAVQAANIQKQVTGVASLGPQPVVLGFNEPDNPGQSNMTVDEALAFWPEVSALATRTVAPAPTHPFDDWYTEFFQRATALGLTFDYFALHMYPGGDAQLNLLSPRQAAAYFLSTVDQCYATYGLPIWITEFALADWGAKTVGHNRYTPEDSLEFMQAVLPKLEMWPHVARYAWYGAGPSAATSLPLGPSALFDTAGDPTALGEFYAGFQGPGATATAGTQAGGAGR